MARAACILAVLVVACDPDYEGLGELFSPDPTYVAFPGDRIAQGALRPIGTDGSREGTYALARDEEDALVVAPLTGGETCTVGPAERILSFGFLYGNAADYAPFVFVQNQVEVLATAPFNPSGPLPWRGDLSVFDFDCEPRLGPYFSSQALAISPHDLATAAPLLALMAGELHALDPWHDASEFVAGNVTAIGQVPGRLYTVEDGQLVVRGRDLEAVEVVASGVTELAVEPYGERLLFVDASGLFFVPEPDAPPVLVDAAACNAAWVQPRSFGQYASYVTPCAGGDLVLFEPETEGSTVLAPEGVSPPAVVPNAGGNLVFFLTSAVVEDAHLLGTLWGGLVEGPFTRLGERARLDTISFPWAGRVLVRVDFEGDRARLLSWEIGGEAVEVASAVRDVTLRDRRWLVLANHDGTSGDLLWLDSDLTTTLLASGVPEFGVNTSGYEADVLLSDYDGATGTLLLLESGGTEVIATGVPRDGFAFIAGSALGYLHDLRAATGQGTLSVRVLDTGDIFDQSEVTSWTVASWPEPGVLYAARQALWWAPAR